MTDKPILFTQELTPLGVMPSLLEALEAAGAPPEDVQLLLQQFQELASDPMEFSPPSRAFLGRDLIWVLHRPVSIKTELMFTEVKGGVLHLVQMVPRSDDGIHVYMQNLLVMHQDVPSLSEMIMEEAARDDVPFLFSQLGGLEREKINTKAEEPDGE